jgi:hypothetical protein
MMIPDAKWFLTRELWGKYRGSHLFEARAMDNVCSRFTDRDVLQPLRVLREVLARDRIGSSRIHLPDASRFKEKDIIIPVPKHHTMKERMEGGVKSPCILFFVAYFTTLTASRL